MHKYNLNHNNKYWNWVCEQCKHAYECRVDPSC